MKKVIQFLLLFFMQGVLLQAADIKTLSLDACAKDAENFSYELKRLGALERSARAAVTSADAAYYPSLNFDAGGGWVSNVPKIELGPLNFEFGDNWSYSAGPTLEYILFDYGGRGGASKSARAARDSALENLNFARKKLTLDVRSAYFTVQQDLERMYLAAGQLKVARKQMKDVNSSFKAGAKSSLDVAAALKQELRARVNISIARGALGAHLKDLFRLTGADYGINPLYPADWRVEITAQDEPATSVIKADSLENALKRMRPYGAYEFDENNAALAALGSEAAYYENLAAGLKSALYPALKLSGGVYWEYPNGPIRENVLLGRAGVSMRVPLFEASKTRAQALAQQGRAEAAGYQKLDTRAALKNMFYSSKDLLYSLAAQAALTSRMIEAGETAAALTYDAYKAGSVTFLEVDNANLDLLESRVALADIYIDILNRLAVMDSLGRAGSYPAGAAPEGE